MPKGGENAHQAERAHNLFEHLSPVLIALELIETRAGRSQQHHVPRLRHGVRFAKSILQRLRMYNFYTS